MAKNESAAVGVQEAATKPAAGAAQIASRGIRTADDAAAVMSALVTDVLNESVNVRVANAACNAMGKLLKAAEMQHKYGGGAASPAMRLAEPTAQDDATVKLEARKRQLREELAALESA